MVKTFESFGDKVKKNTRELKKTVTPTPTPKKKVGRPKVKLEECKNINVAVPISTLEKVEIAKIMYKDNLTLYINKLIEKDLEANYDKYKSFADVQSNMMN